MRSFDDFTFIFYFLNPVFTICHDAVGNEIIFLKQMAPALQLENYTKPDEDKTTLEATENHIHFFRHITNEEIPYLVSMSQAVGRYMLQELQHRFPQKEFVFYTEISDCYTVRFHQKWEGELDYFEADEPGGDQELRNIVTKFKLEEGKVLIKSSFKQFAGLTLPETNLSSSIGLFSFFTLLFAPAFRTVPDGCGNQYVFWKQKKAVEKRDETVSRTEYEAEHNTMQLFLEVTKKEQIGFTASAYKVGFYMIKELSKAFPGRDFVLYTETTNGGELITTFHQAWPEEPAYYDMKQRHHKSDSAVYRFSIQKGAVSVQTNQSKQREKAVQKYLKKTEDK